MKVIYEPGDVVCRTVFAKATPKAKEDSKAVINGDIYAYIMGVKTEKENILSESVLVLYDKKKREFLTTYVDEVDCDPEKTKKVFPFTIDGYECVISDEHSLSLPFVYMWEEIQSTKECFPDMVVYGYKKSFNSYGRRLADKVEMLGDKMQYKHMELASDNILGVSVGTNGHQYGNSGRGTFGHICLANLACTGWEVDIRGSKSKPRGIDIYFEGDAELDVAVVACEQIAAKLRELADNKIRGVEISEKK